MLSGVYFAEDRITQKAPHDAPASLKLHVTPAHYAQQQKTPNNENEKIVLRTRLAQLEDEWSRTSERLADLDAQITAATQDLANFKNGKQE